MIECFGQNKGLNNPLGRQRDEQLVDQLLAIWRSSVRATHNFLSEQDIEEIEPEVPEAILGIESLCVYADDDGSPLGFIGVDGVMIEMPFVDEVARGQGVGKALITYALDTLGAQLVDVNEQNTQAVGFYQHLGFSVADRSELDSQGRPFPLLHLKYEQKTA